VGIPCGKIKAGSDLNDGEKENEGFTGRDGNTGFPKGRGGVRVHLKRR